MIRKSLLKTCATRLSTILCEALLRGGGESLPWWRGWSVQNRLFCSVNGSVSSLIEEVWAIRAMLSVCRNRVILAIAIVNLHRRPEIAAISGTILNKETLRLKGTHVRRSWLRFDSANSQRRSCAFCGISLWFDPCEGKSLSLRFATLVRSALV